MAHGVRGHGVRHADPPPPGCSNIRKLKSQDNFKAVSISFLPRFRIFQAPYFRHDVQTVTSLLKYSNGVGAIGKPRLSSHNCRCVMEETALRTQKFACQTPFFSCVPELFDRLLGLLGPLHQVGECFLCGLHVAQHTLRSFIPQTPVLTWFKFKFSFLGFHLYRAGSAEYGFQNLAYVSSLSKLTSGFHYKTSSNKV